MIDDVTVKRAVGLIRSRADYDYFFSRLGSPDWIAPLRARGFFARPEPVERREESIWVPLWPESQFLARVAAQAPTLVMDTILSIPPTSNPRILDDYIAAALAMPGAIAARIAGSLDAWAPDPPGFLFVGRLAGLGLHFATEGEDTASLSVVRKLVREGLADDAISTWEYAEALAALVREIPDRLRLQFLALCVELLSENIDNEAHRTKPQDYSYIWRPAIEEHRQNLASDNRNALVSCIRDLADVIVSHGPAGLPEVTQVLESTGWNVLRRIALHVIRGAGSSAEALAKARLLENPIAGTTEWDHELVVLLKAWFPELEAAEKTAVLEAIAAGLRIEEWRNQAAGYLGRAPTEEEEQRGRAYYFVERLTPVADSLPPAWKSRFESWTELVGKAEHPEFVRFHRGAWGVATSPMDTEELQNLSVPEIVGFLKDWTPEPFPKQPSIEGLGNALADAVKQRPAEFAIDAALFVALPPEYVRSLISGISQAIKAGSKIAWNAVLSVCTWVCEQHAGNATGSAPGTEDSWQWTRIEVARLLEEALERSGSDGLPYESGEVVWRLIASLCEDPDPASDSNEERSGTRDVVTAAINSTRGIALSAAMRYAIWMWQHRTENVPWSFALIPEVRAALERRLDPAVDPAPAVRAVYGLWLPNLVALDRGWVGTVLERIFPASTEHAILREAAWTAYVTCSVPYDNVFDLLRKAYQSSIEALPTSQEADLARRDARRALAEHLMTYYWRGKEPIDDPDSLVRRFFMLAPDALRGTAFEFIGRSLCDEEGQVSGHVLERLSDLWKWRLESAESGSTSAFRNELTWFGGWYASGRFDESWAIEQLLRALRIGGRAEPEHLVIDRLRLDAIRFPLPTIRSLGLMLDGDRDGWRALSWRDDIRAIIRSVMSNEDETSREAAVDLVHKLGARGYFEFRDLLVGNA